VALPRVPRVLVEDRIAKRLARLSALESSRRNHVRGHQGPARGTVLIVDAAGAVTMRRYWEPHAAPEHINRDESYYVETYRKLLTEAVACRVRRATAPAGLFMGGGFDSSSICALAARPPRNRPQVRRRLLRHAGGLSRNDPTRAEMGGDVPPAHAESRRALRDERRLDIFTALRPAFSAATARAVPTGPSPTPC